MEGEIDFDPFTPEGREDINNIVDEDLDAFLPEEGESSVDWWGRTKRVFGKGARYAADRMRDVYKPRKQTSTVHEYLKLENLENISRGIPENISKSWYDGIRLGEEASSVTSLDLFQETFPKADLNKVDFVYTMDHYSRDILLVRLKDVSRGTPKPYIAIDGDGMFNPRNNIPKSILKALGEPNFRIREENLSQRLSDSEESFEDALAETSTIISNKAADISKFVDNMQDKGKDSSGEEMELKKLQEANNDVIREVKNLVDKMHRNQVVRTGLEQEVEELKAELAANEEARMKDNKLLVDAHGRELKEGRKALEEVTEKKTKLEKKLKEREGQLKDLDLKYRQTKAEALNKGEALKRLTGMHNDFVGNYLKEFDALNEEKNQLFKEKQAKENKLKTLEQSLEDYEKYISSLQEKIRDELKTEEEKEALREELERLTKARDEAKEEVEQMERELGLTRREKIMRYLKLAGLGIGVAGGIASIISFILNALDVGGSVVKYVGGKVADAGKKIAASIPGLIGAALSLILKTGGELLKFIGNNIWILVVALGAVLLKGLTEKR